MKQKQWSDTNKKSCKVLEIMKVLEKNGQTNRSIAKPYGQTYLWGGHCG